MNKAQIQEKIDETKKAMQQLVDNHNVLAGQLNAFIYMLDECIKMESQAASSEPVIVDFKPVAESCGEHQ